MITRRPAPRLMAMWVSILAVGCQTTSLHVREPLGALDPRPAAWISALEEKAEGRRSLRAALRLSLDSPQFRFRRPQRLALRRPASLRVEVVGLFGQLAAVLVTDGVTYQSFDASRKEIESGNVESDLLWRLARIDLQPEEAVDLLLGAPLPSAEASLSGAFTAPGEGVSLEFRAADGLLRERIGFDARGQLREFVRFGPRGGVAWQAAFSDYRDVSGERFAFDVRLRFPAVDAEAVLRFDAASLGLELDDELFALQFAAGAAVR